MIQCWYVITGLTQRCLVRQLAFNLIMLMNNRMVKFSIIIIIIHVTRTIRVQNPRLLFFLFSFTLLSQWEFFPSEICVDFPKESQLRQSRATQPSLITSLVYVEYFCVTTPPAVRPTLLRQTAMGSLTCAQM